jgi:L-iditol 2-dehydrogenase
MHRPGAYAEYVTVPTRRVVAWPEQLPAEIATLAEPLANGVHVVSLIRQLEPQQVFIIGAGPIGLMCQQVFQAMLSVEVIVSDLIPEHLEVATKLGAKHVVNAREEDLLNAVLDLTEGEGADVVVDAVGGRINKQQSLKTTRTGGATVWIGLHEDTA